MFAKMQTKAADAKALKTFFNASAQAQSGH